MSAQQTETNDLLREQTQISRQTLGAFEETSTALTSNIFSASTLKQQTDAITRARA